MATNSFSKEKISLELGTTQKELAKRLRITQSTLSDYEAGRRKSFGIKFLKKWVLAII